MSQFDSAKTTILAELFSVPVEQRDEPWEHRFYAAIPDAPLRAFDPQVEFGPDGFPYFHLALPETAPATPVSVAGVRDHCLDNGYGIVIYGDASRGGRPAWVFSYGSLLCYRLYGAFDHNPAEPGMAGGSKSIVSHGGTVLLSTPSEAYLPMYARRAMADFFRKVLKHPDPRIILFDNPEMMPMRNLMV